jgi:bifunctional non-homologous end joining protein LigD
MLSLSASCKLFVRDLAASATQLIQSPKELALEGIIAKKKESLYESGKRTGARVKYKTNKSQEFVIGSYRRASV